jgi:hypothetical protein
MKHGKLMAEHEDLGVFRYGVRPVDASDVEDASKEAAEERQGHGRRA